ncbi:hypothetical protein OKW29_000116 [Paraburkholderia sp. CI3]
MTIFVEQAHVARGKRDSGGIAFHSSRNRWMVTGVTIRLEVQRYLLDTKLRLRGGVRNHRSQNEATCHVGIDKLAPGSTNIMGHEERL